MAKLTAASCTEMIRRPAAHTINTGMKPASRDLLRAKLGEPRPNYTTVCKQIAHNPKLAKRMKTATVGHIKVHGLDVAVDRLVKGLESFRKAQPVAFDQLKYYGMLCCRQVRGSRSVSTHSWGIAVDFSFGSRLDAMGDGQVQRGLLELYAHLKRHGFYWGAGFSREDGMHFELSTEELRACL